MQLIPNQPINFGTYFETAVCPPCKDDKEYCSLYNHGDPLTAQWIADPCSEELICNPEFAVTLGAELLTNGDFAGGTSSWDLDYNSTGTPWLYNTNKVNTNSGSGTLAQAITLVAGNRYQISFEILNWVSGVLTVGTDQDTILISYTITNGVYSFSFTATGNGGNIYFYNDPANDFDLTNVSLKEVIFNCWDTEDSGWNFAADKACHDGSAAFTGALINTNVVLITGTYYRVSITIAGLTTGSINLYLGGTTETLDTNGTFIRFITSGSTDTVFKIIPTSDFDGCLSAPSLFKYASIDDYKAGLFDKDGNFVQDIGTGHLTYKNDFVSINWPVDTLDGCYKICVTEICREPLGWDNWTLEATSDAGLTIDNKLIFTGGGSGTSTATHSVGTLQACTYTFNVRFGDIDPSHEGNDIRIDFGDAFVVYTIDGTTANSTQSFEFIPSPAINEDIIFSFDNDATGDLEILYILISSSCEGQQDPDFCSSCINIKESHECTMDFAALCNEPALGFNFTPSVFFLFQRLRCSFLSPIGQGPNGNYKLSNGSYYKYFAEKDKVFDLVFLPVDENTHDAIDTMLRCDLLAIGSVQHLYTWLDTDYKPEWDKKGALKLVESRIQIRRTGGHLTNSNCS